MDVIKAIVRKGRLETAIPIDLPDGTEILIPLSNGAPEEEDGWDNSPEGISAWLKWADSLEPLIRTEKEEAAAERWLKECDRYESEKQNKDVEELFQ